MNHEQTRISLKGLFETLFFLIGMFVAISPAFFCFWLSDWHKKANILYFGEMTTAHVLYMEEEWSRWTSQSAQEAYKNYYIKFEYEDGSGQSWVVTWDASSELFSRVREGSPLPVRYLPGPAGGAIPEGETVQAFTDSGEYGMAGAVGMIYLLASIPFLFFFCRYRMTGQE